MSLLDYVEAWLLSIRPILEAKGVVVRFERSQTNRPNPSCVINVRRNGVEADLLVWESGEAELATLEHDGSSNQQHYDDIRTASDLSLILSRVIGLVSNSSTP